MMHTQLVRLGLPTLLLAAMSFPAAAQSFRVQCPTSTITHPTARPTTPSRRTPAPRFSTQPRRRRGIKRPRATSTAPSSASRSRAATATRRWRTALRPTCSPSVRCPASRTSRTDCPPAARNSRACTTCLPPAPCCPVTRRRPMGRSRIPGPQTPTLPTRRELLPGTGRSDWRPTPISWRSAPPRPAHQPRPARPSPPAAASTAMSTRARSWTSAS
jgi:hypothetical protein